MTPLLRCYGWLTLLPAPSTPSTALPWSRVVIAPVLRGTGGRSCGRTFLAGRRRGCRMFPMSASVDGNGGNRGGSGYAPAPPMLQQTPLRSPYDFSRGHPNIWMLPAGEMRQIMSGLSSSSKDGDDFDAEIRAALNYAPEAGTRALLEEVSSFLRRRTEGDELVIVDEDGEDGDTSAAKNSLFMTNGVSHGLELLCRAQLCPGDVVLVERPTYFLASGVLLSHGLVVRGLPMKSSTDGGAGAIDVDRLVQLVEGGDMAPPRAIYLIPTNQNPTACTMPASDRRKLADFAHRYGVLVIADEVYHLLDWRDVEGGDPCRPARMALFNDWRRVGEEVYRGEGGGSVGETVEGKRIGCCVSVSAFTKIYAPGIRCGWIEAPEPVISSIVNLGYIQSQGGLVPFMGDLLMRRALCSGLCDAFLDRLREEYGRRARRVCDIVEEVDGKGEGGSMHGRGRGQIKVMNRPLGGYFLWIRFPDDVDAEDFLEFCVSGQASPSAGGVRFRPGAKCDGLFGKMTDEERHRNDEISGVSAEDSSLRSCARLCFADLDEDNLYEGAKRLVRAFDEYMALRGRLGHR